MVLWYSIFFLVLEACAEIFLTGVLRKGTLFLDANGTCENRLQVNYVCIDSTPRRVTINMHEAKLIELVKQNRLLYDKTHKDYRKHLKLKKKWMEIAEELNVTTQIVKKRWRTLKDRHIRVMKERSAGNTNIRYRYAKLLSFLDDCNASNETTHDEFDDESEMLAEGFKQEFLEYELYNFQPNQSQNASTSLNNVPKKASTSKAKQRTNQRSGTEAMFANTNNELVLSLLKTVKEDCKPRTKERAFCESLALQLEEANLPSENFRNFQIKIIQLLSDEISIATIKNESVD